MAPGVCLSTLRNSYFVNLKWRGAGWQGLVVAFLYVERQLLENHPTVFISTFKDLGMFCLGECSNFQIDCH